MGIGIALGAPVAGATAASGAATYANRVRPPRLSRRSGRVAFGRHMADVQPLRALHYDQAVAGSAPGPRRARPTT